MAFYKVPKINQSIQLTFCREKSPLIVLKTPAEQLVDLINSNEQIKSFTCT